MLDLFEMKNFFDQQGFSIVEVLVAVGIIGILATSLLAIFNPVGQFQKSRDARRKSDLAEIKKALELFYQDFGRYPHFYDTAGADRYKIRPANFTGTQVINWGWCWTNGYSAAGDCPSGTSTYMRILPSDPTGARRYIYVSYKSDGTDCVLSTDNCQSYRLYSNLERGSKDLQSCTSGNNCPNVPAAASPNYCGIGSPQNCNYGVSSSNVSP